VIVDSGTFPWDNGNFPVMTEPVATYGNLRYWDNFGEYGFCTKLRVEGLRNLGGVLAPFNAFLLLHGMETLPLRMDAHVANAQAIAEWLDADDRVSWVRYAGLPADPGHGLAARYMPKGPGAVFSFGLRGGRTAGEAFIEGVELCSHLANVGDTRTLVIHPGSTTHRQLSEAALQAAGVLPELVRLSVGLEDLDDILFDLDRGLAAAADA
jgi:O-acetylhomoserine (thiol)-lyase